MHVSRGHSSRRATSTWIRIAVASVIITGALVAPTGAYAAKWGWAKGSLEFTASNRILSARQIKRPAAPMTRARYVKALQRFEQYRARTYGTPEQLPGVSTGATLDDVSSDSVYAKAIQLGWLTPVGSSFKGSQPVTGDEASLGVIGALGIRPSMRKFSRRLQRELPGLDTSWDHHASQTFTRVLGMRYNHLQGTEQLEVAPDEAMRFAHIAYMLHKAAVAEQWRLDSLRSYTTFDLPRLGTNQSTVLTTAVSLIGQPYVWAGESEGTQPEGHGGFDCSGFVWRTIINSGVPAAERVHITARTSYDMSAVAKRKRVRRARLKPGDIIFFGSRGTASTPAENYHAGVWMGKGWFVHSSGSNDGVTITRLEGYWSDQFSWGRRALRKS